HRPRVEAAAAVLDVGERPGSRELAHGLDLSLGAPETRREAVLYHGWNDPSISPQNTVNYDESAVKTWRAQEKTDLPASQDFIRLFMVPGMLHCTGGPGTDRFDALATLERWVEHGEAPETIEASHVDNGNVTRTHPLCAYQNVAVHHVHGSTAHANNFSCRIADLQYDL